LSVDRELISAVRSELEHLADPARAPQMQRYMKSEMPYRGVPSPAQKQVARKVFLEHLLSCRDDWLDTVLALWREAAFREERYLTIALAGHARYRDYRTPEVLPLVEELVVTGAWWDLVDAVATHMLAELLGSYPAEMRPEIFAWSRDPSLWKRRSSIICQIGRKKETDLDLLYGCIEPNLSDRDFFIRKAIGWALRAHAWTDPDEVVRYVSANKSRLSPLSRREALKNVPGNESLRRPV
jgi:3-methyladenine DNA glycosylase AlkD